MNERYIKIEQLKLNSFYSLETKNLELILLSLFHYYYHRIVHQRVKLSSPAKKVNTQRQRYKQ